MAWAFGAIVEDGLRVKTFTCTADNTDAGIAAAALMDFTTNGMTDLDAAPDERKIIIVGAPASESCQPVITAATATGVTVALLNPTGAETFTFRVTVRVTRGISR